ncbi:MAG: T9SS C-terminal target domain-containing protein [Calditrichaeota bacterium]|nr:MAG: T9SS C-terminal target domain-containing protein [Calditrichota bacterium]MBL1205671.1 T9SS C-terminal target domain-containing protein [Calditrichota bacterium]NOG45499.1 T9SS type A sorting domain-containing protein [Calditrichota bacterium]
MFKKLLLTFSFALSGILNAQVTGLSDWTVFVDPGHSQTENTGIYNYSEAHKVLRIAWYLQELLETKTDISAVYLSRTNDEEIVSLSQRTAAANSINTTWYHSIHSDASSPTANSTLLLHGGWRQNGATVEKSPKGGKRMSDIMVDLYSRAMRISTRGNYADRTFYQGFPDNHANLYPYLHVNRESNMTSELSEGGHHTNPAQNQLNMNDDWKKIEAYAIFWTFLKYHGLPRPQVDVVAGIVSNLENGKPINGATISINDTSYITDTYASLFHKYSTDPEQLANGFYYLDGFDQDSLEITVSAEGYLSQTQTIAMVDSFFTFKDFEMISNVPPYITVNFPAEGDTNVLDFSGIRISFSRPMNRDSVEAAFSIEPGVDGTFKWIEDDYTLFYQTENMLTNTEYVVVLDSSAEDKYGNTLDANGDGITGDGLIFSFKTGKDENPPVLQSQYPGYNKKDIELLPVLSYEYNEVIDSLSILDDPITLTNDSNSSMVNGTTLFYSVNNKTVFNYFPLEKLEPLTRYLINIQSGFEDVFGNATASELIFPFTTGNEDWDITSIDNFDAGFTSYWWQPSQSGSTTGIKESTKLFVEDSILNRLTESTQTMGMDYEWDLGSSSWLLREYLSGGPARSKTFDKSYKLQVYIFGDGSNTKFRFALDEGTSTSNWTGHEVSVWFPIDWIGWRLVEWDLSDPDMVGSWLGNGKLDKSKYRIDSFQLTYDSSSEKGTVYFDDLRLVKTSPVLSLENNPNEIPKNYILNQNYPNPFNPTTKINYEIPKAGKVFIDVFNSLGQRVEVLVESYQPAGKHTLVFNGSKYSAGTYTIRMRINNKSFVKKMTLLK